MADTGTPPVIPGEFQQYNSYVIDPQWQRRFTAIWASFAGFALLAILPFFEKRRLSGWLGLREHLDTTTGSHTGPKVRVPKVLQRAAAFLLWSAPGTEVTLGQVLVVFLYFIVVLLCIVIDSPLVENSNRAGFLALAQLTPVFLFSAKSNPLASYAHYNVLHRWAGRILFLSATLHGAMWINQHRKYGVQIIGEEKETYGMAAFGCLGIIVLSSLRWVRRAAWEVFMVIHLIAFPTFFILICYHTPYAIPWVLPPLAIYGFDVMSRMVRVTVKDAVVEAREGGMTIITVPHAHSGWTPGQHVRVRVLSLTGRAFESHPLTILSTSQDGEGVLLGARAAGDWSSVLFNYASSTAPGDLRLPSEDKKGNALPEGVIGRRHAYVMLEGPYGGCTIDPDKDVLLVAGGSGLTFALGVLGDNIYNAVPSSSPRKRRIQLVWCIRGFGHIRWFAPQLQRLAQLALAPGRNLELKIRIFVTCLCDPEGVPAIANCVVEEEIGARPSGGVYALLREFAEGTELPELAEPETGMRSLTTPREPRDIAVCASGPESLTREASNAAARGVGRGVTIELHTELFSL